MVDNSQQSIAIYLSNLRAFSFILFGLLIAISGILFITTSNQLTIYSIAFMIIGFIISIYGVINLAFRKHPVILFNNYGFIYSTYSRPKLFIPKDYISAISLQNTPNKRIIVTLKQLNTNYKQLIKNIRLPSHLLTCPQQIPELKGNNIIISTDNLHADSHSLIELLNQYLTT